MGEAGATRDQACMRPAIPLNLCVPCVLAIFAFNPLPPFPLHCQQPNPPPHLLHSLCSLRSLRLIISASADLIDPRHTPPNHTAPVVALQPERGNAATHYDQNVDHNT